MRRSELERLRSDAYLKAIAHSIRTGAYVLFITGAGLSVASGIAPYRGTKNAIWSKFVLEWGTKKKFKKNPSKWWNEYWLRTHESPQFINARPNEGHRAIARITNFCNAKVMTQNIDRLHHKTNIDEKKVVEIHGRLGYYKCVSDECKFSHKDYIHQIDFKGLALEGTSMEEGNLKILPPLCPECGDFLMPLSLFFDETYVSHTYYQWDKAAKWMVDCDIMVFVGTSFSVGITQTALEIAMAYHKPVYSFNLFEEDIDAQFDLENVFHVIGKAEVTLPILHRYIVSPRELYVLPHTQVQRTLRFLHMDPNLLDLLSNDQQKVAVSRRKMSIQLKPDQSDDKNDQEFNLSEAVASLKVIPKTVAQKRKRIEDVDQYIEEVQQREVLMLDPQTKRAKFDQDEMMNQKEGTIMDDIKDIDKEKDKDNDEEDKKIENEENEEQDLDENKKGKIKNKPFKGMREKKGLSLLTPATKRKDMDKGLNTATTTASRAQKRGNSNILVDDEYGYDTSEDESEDDTTIRECVDEGVLAAASLLRPHIYFMPSRFYAMSSYCTTKQLLTLPLKAPESTEVQRKYSYVQFLTKQAQKEAERASAPLDSQNQQSSHEIISQGPSLIENEVENFQRTPHKKIRGASGSKGQGQMEKDNQQEGDTGAIGYNQAESGSVSEDESSQTPNLPQENIRLSDQQDGLVTRDGQIRDQSAGSNASQLQVGTIPLASLHIQLVPYASATDERHNTVPAFSETS
ncbi:MAG: putative NAD-dependent deacetylase sir2E [Streblomastix strix]|uniref:Putative NAD-dependent deacetylase sir2E n=1 Tax=Streblomastix strix TaxID=222440 RepID=A0A5J4VJN4_9EUKA|nr:MAG: putative NAD-dependent deacetylase sir2E [Streblomastix strix]